MKIVVAPQEFKESLTAREVAKAMAEGVRRALPQGRIDVVPMADGGPGTVEAVVATGGVLMRSPVHDALGRLVPAEWALVGGTAVIEMAQAAGLWRLRPQERDPRLTSTYGVGELMRAALEAGCQHLIVGLGGSATNDGGAGMARALGARFLNRAGQELPPGGAALSWLSRIDVSGLDERLLGSQVVAATDVTNPLCGPEGASLVYGPQKGATPETARALDAALKHYGELVERDLGVRVLEANGAGAAGGLGAGLIAFLGATVHPGVEVVAEVVGLAERIKDAHLVLTGEGRLDGQTLYGKTVAGVAGLAKKCGVPAIAVVGSLGEGWQAVLTQGVEAVEAMAEGPVTEAEAMGRAGELLADTTERAVRKWLAGQSKGK